MSKRNLISAFFVAAALSGCGGGGDDENGTVYFKIDAATCRGTSANMVFYMNGSQVGTQTLSVGGTSKGFDSPAGSVVLAAREVNGLVWRPGTYDVPAGGSFTLLLTCN